MKKQVPAVTPAISKSLELPRKTARSIGRSICYVFIRPKLSDEFHGPSK